MAAATKSTAPKNANAAKLAARNASLVLSGATIDKVNKAAAGPGEWVGGIAVATYSDVYEADGSLKLLRNNDDKITGRYIKDENGTERKCYNKFIGLALAGGVAGISEVEVDGEMYPVIEGAEFGIKSFEDTKAPKQEYLGQLRHPIGHELMEA